MGGREFKSRPVHHFSLIWMGEKPLHQLGPLLPQLLALLDRYLLEEFGGAT